MKCCSVRCVFARIENIFLYLNYEFIHDHLHVHPHLLSPSVCVYLAAIHNMLLMRSVVYSWIQNRANHRHFLLSLHQYTTTPTLCERILFPLNRIEFSDDGEYRIGFALSSYTWVRYAAFFRLKIIWKRFILHERMLKSQLPKENTLCCMDWNGKRLNSFLWKSKANAFSRNAKEISLLRDRKLTRNYSNAFEIMMRENACDQWMIHAIYYKWSHDV